MIPIVDKLRTLLLLCTLLLLPSLIGCNGCKRDESEKLTREELEKKRREEREAIVAADLISLPYSLN